MPDFLAVPAFNWLFESNINAILVLLGIVGWFVYSGLRRWKRRSLGWRTTSKGHHHRHNVQAAERVLDEFRSWDTTRLLPRIIAYLRQIDPYVFEEMVLTALERQGGIIERNLRYSGDGGIDGRCRLYGELYLVQAKRYRGSIQTQHLRDLSDAIAREGADGGLFVHTGKTPSAAYHVMALDPRITLVSGQDLVDLVRGVPTTLQRITDASP